MGAGFEGTGAVCDLFDVVIAVACFQRVCALQAMGSPSTSCGECSLHVHLERFFGTLERVWGVNAQFVLLQV